MVNMMTPMAAKKARARMRLGHQNEGENDQYWTGITLMTPAGKSVRSVINR
jgi:hypothetical protein